MLREDSLWEVLLVVLRQINLRIEASVTVRNS